MFVSEGRDRGGVRVADDRLGGEVEDGVDADCPAAARATSSLVAQVADDVVDLARDPLQLEAAGRVAVAIERGDLGAGLEQRLGEPGPGESPRRR